MKEQTSTAAPERPEASWRTDIENAPDGTVWLCTACGKTAEDRYGIEGKHSPGWDESCMLNSVLVDKLRRPIADNIKRRFT